MRLLDTILWLSAPILALSAMGVAGPADLEALEGAFVRSVDGIRPAVVSIAVPYRPSHTGPVRQAELSGVIVRPGHIASLSNLLGTCREAVVTYLDGKEARASVLGYDPVYGLGVLKCDRDDIKPVQIAAQSSPRPGSWVVMVGNAFGLRHSVSWGVVSGLRQAVQVQGRPPVGMVQMTTPVNPGDSGCAVVNLRGELVGLASSSYGAMARGAPNSGISFAVPSAPLMASVDQIMATGRVARGWLGAAIATVYLPYSRRQAVQVVAIASGSPSDRAGLKVSDIILSLDSEPMMAMEQVEALVLTSKPRQKIEMEIIRQGRRATLSAELGQWRPQTIQPTANVDTLIHHPPQPGSIRLSSADRSPRSAAMRQRLRQMHDEILQLLKETEP